MKIRAKANGNIVEMADNEAQPLVDAGIFERVEEEPTEEAKPKGRQKYQRRDMAAED